MRFFAVAMPVLILVAPCAAVAGPLTTEDEAFEKRFKEISDLGVTLKHHPALDGPWGSRNPDAAPEMQQFAFIVGRHECTQYFDGMNPSNPDQKLEGDLLWLAYYALDGRAIRDELAKLPAE